MRETFTSSQTAAHHMTQTSSTNTTINTFLKTNINRAKKIIEIALDIYRTQITQTASTVADQQYYHYPPDLGEIESIKVTIGDHDYILEPINSQAVWDQINSITLAVDAFPRYFFPRKSDFGMYPIPQDAYTMTMVYTPKNSYLVAEDYTAGTVTVTNNSATVTGSGTTFTSAMVGRYFSVTNDGKWYKIKTFSSTTSIVLETVYEGASAAGEAYTIGESYEFPEELHSLPAYYSAGEFFMQMAKDPVQAQLYFNMFYTGDLKNGSRKESDAVGGLLRAKQDYMSRSSTGIAYKNRYKGANQNTKNWATTIS